MSSSLLRSLLNQGTATNTTTSIFSSSSSSSKDVGEKSSISEFLNLAMKGSRVRCDAPPPPPSLPPPLPDESSSSSPPPPPPSVEEEDAIAKAAKDATSVASPGPYEGATMDVKRLVTLDTVDGARFEIQKQLSPFFMVQHSFWLGTTMLPEGRNKTYSFTTQAVSDDGTKLFMAQIDPEKRSLNGRFHFFPLGTKAQLTVSPEGSNDQMMAELDLGSELTTWSANIKYGSMGGGNLFGANYYQSITPRFAMGGEGMYLAANKALLSNYTARYHFTPADSTDPNTSTVIGQWNPAQQMLSLYYKRTVTPGRVNVGAELSCNPLSPDQSQFALGAEFNLTRSKLNLCVAGDGRIQTVVETKLGMA